MAEMIRLPDGSMSAVLCLRDFMELTGQWMGSDARAWIEGYLEDIRLDERYPADLEEEAEKLRYHHRQVMSQLRKESRAMAGIIGRKRIDRKALSEAAGRIGKIIWEEGGR